MRRLALVLAVVLVVFSGTFVVAGPNNEALYTSHVDGPGEGGSYVPKLATPNNSGSYNPVELAMAETDDSSTSSSTEPAEATGSISG